LREQDQSLYVRIAFASANFDDRQASLPLRHRFASGIVHYLHRLSNGGAPPAAAPCPRWSDPETYQSRLDDRGARRKRQ
jgi:hypothetical protein